MAEFQNIEFPEDGLQWCVWFIPDFNDNESLFVMKVHHVVADGLGICLLFASLQDNYNPKDFIQTSEVLSFCYNFLITLLKPFTITYALLFFLFW